MKIVQLTDLHIALEQEETLGVDVRANFLRVLPKVESLRPDLLVLSGDLAFRDAATEVYAWVKEKVDALGIPYELISGNHDEPVQLARAFGREDRLRNDKIFFSMEVKGYELQFLDTTVGVVSHDQLDWLGEQVARLSGELYLFMHHPPLFGGVPHMDTSYSLQNMQEVQAILHRFAGQVHIFCGHYHVDKVLQQKNVTVYITPATFFQIDQHFEEFRVDHTRPGLREIVIDQHGLRTNTLYP